MASHSTPDQVKAAVDEPGAMILDVRTEEELKEARLTSRDFHHLSCSLSDCSELIEKAEQLMPDKNAPVIVFCRSGRRAEKAKGELEAMGYKRVLNAGGLTHVESYL